jgi:hypothetical protein
MVGNYPWWVLPGFLFLIFPSRSYEKSAENFNLLCLGYCLNFREPAQPCCSCRDRAAAVENWVETRHQVQLNLRAS